MRRKEIRIPLPAVLLPPERAFVLKVVRYKESVDSLRKRGRTWEKVYVSAVPLARGDMFRLIKLGEIYVTVRGRRQCTTPVEGREESTC